MGRVAHMYDDPKSKADKADLIKQMREILVELEGNDGPIFEKGVSLLLSANFLFPILPTHEKRGVEDGDTVVVKPDLDNLEKLLKDAITDSGIVWHDDSQVTAHNTQKCYTQGVPRTFVRIEKNS
jgi:Holliday junction resolvase RusA-like endonuclease